MRKPLLDMETTERYLFNRMTETEKAGFTVRLLTEPELYEQMVLQQCTYRLIRYQARQQQKQQLQHIHTHLMQDPEFSKLLHQIFQ
ncbi:MAG: hypothetical protein ACTHMC_16815 [Pseudobacter sp.]|uniref:hypothetical protein n=1 Tax=Pseudobacter sp. TaxID=2045420 RepID=UPI003F81BB21